jgi:hypothetical protein
MHTVGGYGDRESKNHNILTLPLLCMIQCQHKVLSNPASYYAWSPNRISEWKLTMRSAKL